MSLKNIKSNTIIFYTSAACVLKHAVHNGYNYGTFYLYESCMVMAHVLWSCNDRGTHVQRTSLIFEERWSHWDHCVVGGGSGRVGGMQKTSPEQSNMSNIEICEPLVLKSNFIFLWYFYFIVMPYFQILVSLCVCTFEMASSGTNLHGSTYHQFARLLHNENLI